MPTRDEDPTDQYGAPLRRPTEWAYGCDEHGKPNPPPSRYVTSGVSLYALVPMAVVFAGCICGLFLDLALKIAAAVVP